MRTRLATLAGLVVAIAAGVALAFSAIDAATAAKVAPKRTVFLTAVEWKGSTNVASEAFPADSVLPGGGGYKLVTPDAAGAWGVQTYRFDTPYITVFQGEQVTLEILGVNGKEHAVAIPAFGRQATITRGRITKVTFTAKKAGIFRLVCHSHMPAMVADIVVLPRSAT